MLTTLLTRLLGGARPQRTPDDGSADRTLPVRVRNLTKTFPSPAGGRERALDDVSFSVRPGEFVALVGPDGAGKTTLLRTLAGLLRSEGNPDGVRIFGRAPDTERSDFTASVGVMPQRFGLYEELSVRENLACFADLKGVPRAEFEARSAELLRLTGLAGFEERPAGKLSGGMKRKLGLTALLLTTPPLLFLDEPTVGVDPLSRSELRSALESIRRRQPTTVLWATAYLDEAETADRVLLLRKGRLVADAAPEALRERVRTRTYRAEARNPADAPLLARRLMRMTCAALPRSPWLDAVPRGDGTDLLLAVEPTSTADREEAFDFLRGRAGDTGLRITERPPTLEDAYAALTFQADSEPTDGPLPSPEEDPSPMGKTQSAEADRSEPVIEARGISRRFGDFTAVADSDFRIRKGEIFGLLGPNGAGKTTTFRMLCGLLPPSGGTIRVAGEDLLAAAPAARAKIGYVAQRFSLYERLTIEETLRYFGESYGVCGRELDGRLERLFGSAGVGTPLGRYRRHRAGLIPMGAKRELAMACALLHRPAILFLDEATSGADLAARRDFWRRIVAIAETGTTVVVTTHFLEEAEYCDRFLIQDAGRVLILGTPAEVRRTTGGSTIEEAFRRIVLQTRAEAAR